jgi:hypothetical protein
LLQCHLLLLLSPSTISTVAEISGDASRNQALDVAVANATGSMQSTLSGLADQFRGRLFGRRQLQDYVNQIINENPGRETQVNYKTLLRNDRRFHFGTSGTFSRVWLV